MVQSEMGSGDPGGSLLRDGGGHPKVIAICPYHGRGRFGCDLTKQRCTLSNKAA
jgi:hypothetical protein